MQDDLLVEASRLLTETKTALQKLVDVMNGVGDRAEGKEQAYYFMEQVVPAMENLRKPVDELEMIVDKNMWPMPSYGDLLFEV